MYKNNYVITKTRSFWFLLQDVELQLRCIWETVQIDFKIILKCFWETRPRILKI